MNILITGGAGFIGSNLVNLLSKNKKYKIIIIDNFSKGSINYIKKYNVKVKKGDIKNYKFLKKCFKKIDCVIHLAGSTRVIDSIKDPISNFKENLIGTLNVPLKSIKIRVYQMLCLLGSFAVCCYFYLVEMVSHHIKQ